MRWDGMVLVRDGVDWVIWDGMGNDRVGGMEVDGVGWCRDGMI